MQDKQDWEIRLQAGQDFINLIDRVGGHIEYKGLTDLISVLAERLSENNR